MRKQCYLTHIARYLSTASLFKQATRLRGTGGEGQGTTKVVLATSLTPALIGREKTICLLQRTTDNNASGAVFCWRSGI